MESEMVPSNSQDPEAGKKFWHIKAAEGRLGLLEHSTEEAEWVKTGVYSMSQAIRKLKGFPPVLSKENFVL